MTEMTFYRKFIGPKPFSKNGHLTESSFDQKRSNGVRLNGDSVKWCFGQMAFGQTVFGQMVFRSNGLSVKWCSVKRCSVKWCFGEMAFGQKKSVK
jgi:hypothetical protein